MSLTLQQIDIVFITIKDVNSDNIITTHLFDNSLSYDDVDTVIKEKYQLVDDSYELTIER